MTFISTVGKNLLEDMEQPSELTRVGNAVSKRREWSLFLSRQTIQVQNIPSLCPDKQCWRSWSWTVLWRPTRSFRTNTKEDVLFIIGDWNTKEGSQETPGVTGKFVLGIQNKFRAKANRVLPRERTGHSKLPLPTTQEKTLHMDITRWSISKSDWLCSSQPKMETLYTVSENNTGSRL